MSDEERAHVLLKTVWPSEIYYTPQKEAVLKCLAAVRADERERIEKGAFAQFLSDALVNERRDAPSVEHSYRAEAVVLRDAIEHVIQSTHREHVAEAVVNQIAVFLQGIARAVRDGDAQLSDRALKAADAMVTAAQWYQDVCTHDAEPDYCDGCLCERQRKRNDAVEAYIKVRVL